jgi:pimeloyl-ACP methyl ester carboxylesterase
MVLLHGWMDVSASWQFVVDAMDGARFIIAPDWRGFGLTESAQADTFWFPDYLADLDLLLDHYFKEKAIDLVGHSMGGNIALLYAGVRPERVRTLVNLEGFGLPATTPEQAPGRMARWIDDIGKLNSGAIATKTYDNAGAVAQRLMKNNPRLSLDKAQWLARHWAREQADGRWAILGHPAHKLASATLYRADEVREIHRAVRANVLSVEAQDNGLAYWTKGELTLEQHHQRMQVLPRLGYARVEDAGHMLHHDQPQRVASLIEGFLART